MTYVAPSKPAPSPTPLPDSTPHATKPAPSLNEAARGDYLTMSDPAGPYQSGPAVSAMQDALRARGYNISDQGGVLGPSTSQAMIEFQRSQQASDPSFKVDGLAGPQTLGALGLVPKAPTDVPSTVTRRAPMEGAPAPEGTVRAGDLARADNNRIQGTPGTTTMVPVQKTPMSGSEAADALSKAWTKRYGTPPSKETLSILTAQWALETGHGKSMCNYNFGGIKGTGPSGLSASYKTKEGWGASEISITDRFRAYNSAEEGASDYLALLDRRYGNALDAARNGDAAGFVHGLKARGYFTGNEEVYTRNVVALSQSALNRGFDSIGAKAA
ncbi:MAG: glucosaminidase domain-containing protein [Myxococcota bacterium]